LFWKKNQNETNTILYKLISANLFGKLTKDIQRGEPPLLLIRMPTLNLPVAVMANNWTFDKKFFVSQEGLKRLKQEYENFKKLKFIKTKDEFPQMMESEDLNPEYLSLQEDIDLLEARIAEIEIIIKNARVIKAPPKEKQDIIDLGARVAVEVNGRNIDFELVGSLEADPDLGRISDESPVGKALLGHRAGEEVALAEPAKTVYKIKKVSYLI